MYPIKINNYKSRQSLLPRFSFLLALGYSFLQLSSVLLTFIRQKSIIMLSYFMAVYFQQIHYLCVTNEKTESSCVTCLGLYLKSGSSAHFLTWVKPLDHFTSLRGIAWRQWCWSHRNRSFAAGIIESKFFSCCLDFLPPCLYLMSLCVDW